MVADTAVVDRADRAATAVAGAMGAAVGNDTDDLLTCWLMMPCPSKALRWNVQLHGELN